MFSRAVGASVVCAALAAGLVTVSAGVREGAASAPAAERFGALPMRFEPNVGQTDERVRFVARAPGYTLFLTGDEAVFALGKGEAVVRMGLVGSTVDPIVEGDDALPGVTNYFLGSDPSRWRTGIVSYAKVRYREVYEGIDLVYYGTPRDLEYDFVVAPGADPSAIRLRIEGADRVAVDERGDLVLSVGRGELRQRAPVIYQEGPNGRERVAGGYVVTGDRVSFSIGDYDAARPLVVDPVVAYSNSLGGESSDWGEGIAVGADGSSYITGGTISTGFPTTSPFQANNAGFSDAFVTKLDPSGTLVYSTYLGGMSDDSATGIAVGADGAAFVTGGTFSTDFPTASPLQASLAGSGDAFVAKLAPSGTALVYSTYLGGSSHDSAQAIALGVDGSALVVGQTNSTNFPIVSAFQAGLAGFADVFVTKLSPSGATLVYSTYLGGNSRDVGHAIVAGADGSAYVTGETWSTNFPTAAPVQASYGGSIDAFVAKLSSSGTALAYSTYLGGSDYDQATGIAVDGEGSAYVTGATQSPNFPTLMPLQASRSGFGDAFVTKLSPAGSSFAYSTYLGGSGFDRGDGIAVGADGGAFVVGSAGSTDFPTLAPTQAVHGGGYYDTFVTKLSPEGFSLSYSTYLGGSDHDEGHGIAVGLDGSVYVTGTVSFEEDPDGFLIPGDAFVAKYLISAEATAGVYIPATSTFFLKYANAPGVADVHFSFGAEGLGYAPIAGDWDGDGVDTVGLYRQPTGVFFLTNVNANGPADLTFRFGVGGQGYVPLAGDWDGDGDDTVGLYHPPTGVFFLRNTNAGGPADVTFTFGVGGAGYVPISGDWDGDGDDTIGLYDPAASVFFLRNTNTPGPADATFGFGVGGLGYVPVAGDWDGDGDDTVGLYRPSTASFFLRNQNLAGAADVAFVYGPPNATPLAGDWNGV